MKPDRNDPIFLAWCAGFIDGEGSIGIYRSRPTKHYYVNGEKRLRKTPTKIGFRLQVSVYQNHIKPLRLIREVFGGSLFYRESTKTWFLVMSGWRAATMLKAMLPYFVVKQDEASYALEFQQLRHEWGPRGEIEKQEEFSANMKLLKFRGDDGKAAV